MTTQVSDILTESTVTLNALTAFQADKHDLIDEFIEDGRKNSETPLYVEEEEDRLTLYWNATPEHSDDLVQTYDSPIDSFEFFTERSILGMEDDLTELFKAFHSGDVDTIRKMVNRLTHTIFDASTYSGPNGLVLAVSVRVEE